MLTPRIETVRIGFTLCINLECFQLALGFSSIETLLEELNKLDLEIYQDAEHFGINLADGLLATKAMEAKYPNAEHMYNAIQ